LAVFRCPQGTFSLTWCERFSRLQPVVAFRQSGFLGLLAGLQSHVVHSEADANFFEEGCGRLPTRKDPDRIVGNLLQLAVHIEDDEILFETQRGPS